MLGCGAAISKGFRRLAERAAITNFRFHDLRHEAVSRIFETTYLSDSEIMSITGHTNVQTLVGYAHLRASFLASQLDGIKRISPKRTALRMETHQSTIKSVWSTE